ncbi:MAG: CDP-4-dehydro-6-deoxyglucose reductase [Candidatus Peregrinibacteria bacterium Gr01-1014_25]|nr:MAG: CDP-4-dehydro-6-deoxyglucose reductase [Candidatus Peregrinibacteria bacterium Gr01-1014_25]
MPTPVYSITCLSSERIARDVYACTFTRPSSLAFAAGQFVLLDVPLVDNPADVQPRAYSIASAPQESELLFAIKLKDGGRASRWVAEEVRPGTSVAMKGPFGVFTLRSGTSPLLLLGTSTGIAPFRAQLIDLARSGDRRAVDAVFGCRSEDDLFWVAELQACVDALPAARLHITLTQPSERWTGHRGRVQTIAPSVVPDLAARDVYACGNPAMVDDVKLLCAGSWGIPKERVHIEGYI